jgi:hypothetical protein
MCCRELMYNRQGIDSRKRATFSHPTLSRPALKTHSFPITGHKRSGAVNSLQSNYDALNVWMFTSMIHGVVRRVEFSPTYLTVHR